MNSINNTVDESNNENQVLKMDFPTMLSISEIMKITNFSYRHLIQLCKEDKIVYVKAGKKYLINYEKFIKYLNTGDKNCAS